MNRVELSELRGASLIRADLEIGPGVHTVVALTPDGAEELVPLAAGLVKPASGAVRVDGQNPFSSPAARRKIGSLLAVEVVAEARAVESWVARALVLRGSSISAASVLDALGLAMLAKRSPGTLSPGEARAVALALALSATEGAVLLLFEPLATPAGRGRVVAAMEEAARRGAAVLSVTASARDASDIGGTTFPLRFGRLGGETALSSLAASPQTIVEMVVRTDDPRRLAAALSLDSVFAEIRCELSASPGELVVAGGESEGVALGILRGARSSGARILAIWQRKRAADAFVPRGAP